MEPDQPPPSVVPSSRCRRLRVKYHLPVGSPYGIEPGRLTDDDLKSFLICPICGCKLSKSRPGASHFGLAYFPWRQVCRKCDQEAESFKGKEAGSGGLVRLPCETLTSIEGSTNPVWIRGVKCYRRYQFGGHTTFLFDEEHESILSGCHKELTPELPPGSNASDIVSQRGKRNKQAIFGEKTKGTQ